MKRVWIALIIITAAAIGSYAVYAADRMGGGMMEGGSMMNNNKKMQPGMGPGGMMGQGMMMYGMGSMMGGSSLTTNEDGGIIVLMGNQLFKYDRDLNFLRQVEVKFDWEGWQKMMMQHQEMMMREHEMMRDRSTMMDGQSDSK